MTIIIIIAVLILPELLKASRTAQQTEQIRARQEIKARELAERQAARVQEMNRRQAERIRAAELKISQTSAQLEQLNVLRDRYFQILDDLEYQLPYASVNQRFTIQNRIAATESKLMQVDAKRAMLWDQVHCA